MAPTLTTKKRVIRSAAPVVRKRPVMKTGMAKVGISKVPSRVDATKVFLMNLPSTCTEADIQELFSGIAAVKAINLRQKEKDDGTIATTAVVEFTKRGFVRKALLTLNGKMLEDEQIQVKLMGLSKQATVTRSGDLRQVLNRRGPEGRDTSRSIPNPRYSASARAKYGETYGLKIDFLKNIGIEGPLVKTILMYNLPPNATEQDVGCLCRIGGNVIDINLIMRKTQLAFVEMGHPLEAVQVISMLKEQMYRGYLLDCSMAYSEKPVRGHMGKTGPYPMSSAHPKGLQGIGKGLGPNGTPLQNLASCAPTEVAPHYERMGTGIPPLMSLPVSGPGSSHSLLGEGPMMPSRPVMAPGYAMISNGMSQMGGRPSLMEMAMESYGGSGRGSHGSGPMFESSSVSPQSLKTFVIEIRNLPTDARWEQLVTLCQRYADPDFAKIVGLGVGRVYFEREGDVRRVYANLNGKLIDGRELQVTIL